MNDEIWDLYTQDRVKTNQKMMRSEKIPSHLYHLAFIFAFLMIEMKC